MIYYPAQLKEMFVEHEQHLDGFGLVTYTCIKGFYVSFTDFPSILTQGRNLSDAISMAELSLKVAIIDLDELNEVYPTPSAPQTGDVMIGVEL